MTKNIWNPHQELEDLSEEELKAISGAGNSIDGRKFDTTGSMSWDNVKNTQWEDPTAAEDFGTEDERA